MMIDLLIRLAVAGTIALATISPNLETEPTDRNLFPEITATVGTDERGNVLSQSVTLVRDNRVQALEQFLAGYDSPLRGEAQVFIATADKYGLDWRFLPAIAGMESLFGARIAPATYNPFGWGGGYIRFESWTEAIQTVGASLGERGQRGGFYGPEGWAKIYCPPNYRNWTLAVRHFMGELEQVNQALSEDQTLALK